MMTKTASKQHDEMVNRIEAVLAPLTKAAVRNAHAACALLPILDQAADKRAKIEAFNAVVNYATETLSFAARVREIAAVDPSLFAREISNVDAAVIIAEDAVTEVLVRTGFDDDAIVEAAAANFEAQYRRSLDEDDGEGGNLLKFAVVAAKDKQTS